MNPPSENHSTVTDDTRDWIVEKFQLGQIKIRRCSSPAASMIRELPRSRLWGRGCRVNHDAMLRFPQRVHLLIASILIVPSGQQAQEHGASSCNDTRRPQGITMSDVIGCNIPGRTPMFTVFRNLKRNSYRT